MSFKTKPRESNRRAEIQCLAKSFQTDRFWIGELFDAVGLGSRFASRTLRFLIFDYLLRMLRATARTCSRNQACAASFVRRGCQLMKYGKGLSSRGGSIVRKLVIRFVIFAKVRGTVSTRSVWAMTVTAGIQNGLLSAT